MSTTAHSDIAVPAIADDEGQIRRSIWQTTLHFCRREPLGAFGMLIVLIIAFAGFSAELIAPYSPTSNDFASMTEAPSWTHLLGTDQFGRDLLSRIIFGARTALIVGLSSAIVGGVAGLVLGVASAYFGGKLDLVFQQNLRRGDGVSADHHGVGHGFDLRHWHAQCDHRDHHPADPTLRARGAIERAGDPRDTICRCGARLRLQPCTHHPAPHGAERDGAVPDHADGIRRPGNTGRGSLSYLGLGVQEPTPAWGLMLQGGAEEYASTAPWIAIFPGLAIALTVFGVSLFGDALRDELDPKLRER